MEISKDAAQWHVTAQDEEPESAFNGPAVALEWVTHSSKCLKVNIHQYTYFLMIFGPK